MILRLVISVFFFVTTLAVNAQTSQPIPGTNNLFTFPESIVCVTYGSGPGAANQIIISTTGLLCDGSIACVIDFNYDPTETFGRKPDPANPGSFIPDPDNLRLFQDGQPIAYSFTQPGSFDIAIVVGAGGTFDELTQNVTVLPNTAPEFDIYNCQNREVILDITDLTFPLYTVDYDNDGTADLQSPPGMVSPTNTYPVGATQAIITVRPDYQGCTSNTKAVQLETGNFTNDHLITRLEVTDANAVDLILQNIGNNIPYLMERSANAVGPFSTIADLSEVTTFSDNPANPDQNFYCYRLTAQDLCNNQTFPSNVICSHSIDLNLQDGFNSIGWATNLSGAGALTLFRNAVAMSPGAPFSNSGIVTDNSVVCGTEYCYRFITDYGASIQSVSKTLCGEAFTTQTPSPINDAATIVDGNSIRLDWLTSENYTASTYSIFRIPTNVALPYAETSELTFTDDTYRPYEGICYQIQFEDVCGNRSDRSDHICPIEVKATLNENDNSVLLDWDAYTGWSAGVDHYTLEKYDENGQLIETLDLSTNGYTDNTSSPGQTFSYKVFAVPVSTLVPQPSVSNVATIIKSPMLYHPTAFVPGSNVTGNDTFSVRGVPEYISSYELRIFNRWGEMMFHSTDMDQSWNGTFKGVTMPEGTYIFKTKVVDTAGRTFDYSGSVVLLRK